MSFGSDNQAMEIDHGETIEYSVDEGFDEVETATGTMGADSDDEMASQVEDDRADPAGHLERFRSQGLWEMEVSADDALGKLPPPPMSELMIEPGDTSGKWPDRSWQRPQSLSRRTTTVPTSPLSQAVTLPPSAFCSLLASGVPMDVESSGSPQFLSPFAQQEQRSRPGRPPSSSPSLPSRRMTTPLQDSLTVCSKRARDSECETGVESYRSKRRKSVAPNSETHRAEIQTLLRDTEMDVR